MHPDPDPQQNVMDPQHWMEQTPATTQNIYLYEMFLTHLLQGEFVGSAGIRYIVDIQGVRHIAQEPELVDRLLSAGHATAPEPESSTRLLIGRRLGRQPGAPGGFHRHNVLVGEGDLPEQTNITTVKSFSSYFGNV